MGNRGYSGYYKNYYLKSSYEYVFAKILDHDNVNWKYEVKTFDLGFKKYKPDFFIYDDFDELISVIEIKSEIKREQEIAIKSLNKLDERYCIKGYMYAYKDLSKMCKERNMKITRLINSWINDVNTTINKSFKGNINPHFNIKHSDKTKELIGIKTKDRWLENREVYLNASKKGAMKAKELFTGQERKKRVTVKCPICSEQFIKIEGGSKIYCSQKCANKVNGKKGAILEKETAQEKRNNIRDFILKWSKENTELIMNTPYNKISNLKDLFNKINDLYSIKDLRIISKSVFGEDRGRKELLKFLKEYVQSENICRANHE